MFFPWGTFAKMIMSGGAGEERERERALRVREHDVRRAERPARQVRMQVRPRWKDSPRERVVESRRVDIFEPGSRVCASQQQQQRPEYTKQKKRRTSRDG